MEQSIQISIQVERNPDLKIGCQSKEEEARMCRKYGKEVFVIRSEREQVSVMEIHPAPAPSCLPQYYSTAGKGDVIFKVRSKHSGGQFLNLTFCRNFMDYFCLVFSTNPLEMSFSVGCPFPILIVFVPHSFHVLTPKLTFCTSWFLKQDAEWSNSKTIGSGNFDVCNFSIPGKQSISLNLFPKRKTNIPWLFRSIHSWW